MGSQIVTWLLTLAVTVFLPRYLGPEAVGKLHLANSLWAIGTILVTFGMDVLLVKEVARNPEKLSSLFTLSLFIRAVLYLLSFGLMAIYANSIGYPAETVSVIYIIGIAFFFSEFIQACYSSLQGLEQMGLSSLANIAGKVFYTVVSIGALLLGYGVTTIATIIVLANLVNGIMQFWALRRTHPLKFNIDFSLIPWMIKASTPYMLSNLFAAAYISIDIVVISLLIKDEAQLGWYAGADSLFGTLMFVPTVFITAIFPALSRMYSEESDSLPQLISKSFNLLLLLSIPIGIGIFAVSNQLVVLLYGSEFIGSGPILAVLSIVLLLTYQNTLLGRYLISIDMQNTWTKVMAIATIATIPLDFLLIPWCQEFFGNGAIGGALAYIFTEGGMMVAGLYLLPKGYLGRENLAMAIKALLCGFLMGAVAWGLRDYFIAIPIIASAIVYPVLILITKTIPKEDMAILQSAGQTVLAKIRR